MSILLIEMNPNDVEVNESLFPDVWKETFVYEHLRYYCSKAHPLPAIKIHVMAEAITVMHGHSYLSIAKDLKRTSIRAVVDKTSSEEAVQQLIRKPSVTTLDLKAIREEEDKSLFSYSQYVFFFEKALDKREREIFEQKIVGFLKQLTLPPKFESTDRIKEVSYPFSGLCAEVEALTSVDERWFAPFRAVISDFHSSVARIASFQGTKYSCISL